MDAPHKEQPEVHQITAAPPLIPAQLVDEVRRHFFVAARQVVGNPDRPARASHQWYCDKIVRQDLAGKRAAAGKALQRAMAHERRDADDRVMAPVMRLAELPEM